MRGGWPIVLWCWQWIKEARVGNARNRQRGPLHFDGREAINVLSTNDALVAEHTFRLFLRGKAPLLASLLKWISFGYSPTSRRRIDLWEDLTAAVS